MIKFLTLGLLTAFSRAANAIENSDGSAGTPVDVAYFLGIAEAADIGYDPHSVHGIQTADGGTVITGFATVAAESNASGYVGFVIKIGPCTTTYSRNQMLTNTGVCGTGYTWVYKYSVATAGKSIKLAWVAEKGDVIVAVGTKQHTSDSYYDRVALFLDGTTGALKGEMVVPETGTSGGYECVEFDSDGAMIVSGFTKSTQTTLLFKSSGIVTTGSGIVEKFSASIISASTFAYSTLAWSNDNTGSNTNYPGTAKVFRIDSDKNIIGLVGGRTTIFKINGATGVETWNTGATHTANGQATDLTIVPDGLVVLSLYFEAISGSEATALYGRLMGTDLLGVQTWYQNHGNPSGGIYQFSGLTTGDPALVKNECWGIQTHYTNSVADGVVFACGTGIEECTDETLTDAQKSACGSDARKTWRSMVYKADLTGTSVWRRLDSYYDSENGSIVAASAAEYIYPAANGFWMVVTDQSFGVGVLMLNTTDATIQTTTTTTLSQYLELMIIVLIQMIGRLQIF